MNAPIQAIIFDCFGVLLDFDESIVQSRLAPHCTNLDPSFDMHSVLADIDLITGKKTLAEVHQTLVESTGLRLSFDEFKTAWLEPYSWPMSGMAHLVRKLSERVDLVLLSNIDADYWHAIRPLHPELDCFKSLLLSFELGLAKPSPKVFNIACSAAGVPASRCLFIDDTLPNVEAARHAGLQALHFTGIDGLKQELGTGGILIRAANR